MSRPDVVIIGAGRSGTNALRDALCRIEPFHTWPCDEINYIWRHGNRDAATDALTRGDARPDVVRKIRQLIGRRRRCQPEKVLVEKTCANSLRVEFVDAVLPDARFVHIVRDGRDVVASARDRWRAPLDIPYLARKARFVPPRDLPHYASRYVIHRLARLRSSESRLPTWGPRFLGMDELAESNISVEELCAHQWVACVTSARTQLATLDADRVLEIRYEELVAAPADVLERVARFADTIASSADAARMAGEIRRGSVGAWNGRLDAGTNATVSPVVAPLLAELGYV